MTMSAEKSIDALVSDVGIDLTDVMPGELRPTPKSSTEIPISLDLDRPPLPPQVDDSIEAMREHQTSVRAKLQAHLARAPRRAP